MHAVLVAGGTGALGGAVLRELLDAGHPVTATWVVERERERVVEELGDGRPVAGPGRPDGPGRRR